MKRNLMYICLLLIVALGAPVARADVADAATYSIFFVGTPPFPTAGSFTYDPDIQTFSSFLVTWNGITFDLTSAANAPVVSATPPPCLGSATGGAASFALLNGDCTPAQGNFTTLWFAQMQPDPIFEFSTYDPTSFIKIYAFDNPQAGYQVAGGDWSLTQPTIPGPGTAPEPGTLVMFASGIVAIAGAVRRKINL